MDFQIKYFSNMKMTITCRKESSSSMPTNKRRIIATGEMTRKLRSKAEDKTHVSYQTGSNQSQDHQTGFNQSQDNQTGSNQSQDNLTGFNQSQKQTQLLKQTGCIQSRKLSQLANQTDCNQSQDDWSCSIQRQEQTHQGHQTGSNQSQKQTDRCNQTGIHYQLWKKTHPDNQTGSNQLQKQTQLLNQTDYNQLQKQSNLGNQTHSDQSQKQTQLHNQTDYNQLQKQSNLDKNQSQKQMQQLNHTSSNRSAVCLDSSTKQSNRRTSPNHFTSFIKQEPAWDYEFLRLANYQPSAMVENNVSKIGSIDTLDICSLNNTEGLVKVEPDYDLNPIFEQPLTVSSEPFSPWKSDEDCLERGLTESSEISEISSHLKTDGIELVLTDSSQSCSILNLDGNLLLTERSESCSLSDSSRKGCMKPMPQIPGTVVSKMPVYSSQTNNIHDAKRKNKQDSKFDAKYCQTDTLTGNEGKELYKGVPRLHIENNVLKEKNTGVLNTLPHSNDKNDEGSLCRTWSASTVIKKPCSNNASCKVRSSSEKIVTREPPSKSALISGEFVIEMDIATENDDNKPTGSNFEQLSNSFEASETDASDQLSGSFEASETDSECSRLPAIKSERSSNKSAETLVTSCSEESESDVEMAQEDVGYKGADGKAAHTRGGLPPAFTAFPCGQGNLVGRMTAQRGMAGTLTQSCAQDSASLKHVCGVCRRAFSTDVECIQHMEAHHMPTLDPSRPTNLGQGLQRNMADNSIQASRLSRVPASFQVQPYSFSDQPGVAVDNFRRCLLADEKAIKKQIDDLKMVLWKVSLLKQQYLSRREAILGDLAMERPVLNTVDQIPKSDLNKETSSVAVQTAPDFDCTTVCNMTSQHIDGGRPDFKSHEMCNLTTAHSDDGARLNCGKSNGNELLVSKQAPHNEKGTSDFKTGHVKNRSQRNNNNELTDFKTAIVNRTNRNDNATSDFSPSLVSKRASRDIRTSSLINDNDDVSCIIQARTGKKTVCSTCHEVFRDPLKFVEHVQRIHSVIHVYACLSCRQLFTDSDRHVRQETRTHQIRRTNLCTHCGKNFSTISDLRTHRRTHVQNRALKCDDCGKVFSHAQTLAVHRQYHRLNKDIKCSVCAKMFRMPQQLKFHMRKHTGERPYLCTVCNRAFSNSSNLTAHRRTHTGEKPYQCGVCRAAFTTISALTVHKWHHSEMRPFRCEFCRIFFVTANAFKRHQETHSGQKKYKCEECGKGFTQQSSLRVHQRLHTGERPFACTYCTAAFKQSAHLTVHLRQHTGEKPFVCKVCKQAFSRSEYLLKHCRREHGAAAQSDRNRTPGGRACQQSRQWMLRPPPSKRMYYN